MAAGEYQRFHDGSLLSYNYFAFSAHLIISYPDRFVKTFFITSAAWMIYIDKALPL